MYCTKCGNELKIGAKFCTVCGAATKLTNAEKGWNPNNSHDDNQQKINSSNSKQVEFEWGRNWYEILADMGV